MKQITKCKECGAQVTKRNNSSYKWKPVDPFLDSVPNNVPFNCSLCGSVRCNLKAIHDYVLVFPVRKQPVQSDVIALPETLEPEDTDYGIVLSFGPGYYSKKKFVRSGDIRVGMKVLYDKHVPWEVAWKDRFNKSHLLRIMPYPNIRMIPKVDECQPNT